MGSLNNYTGMLFCVGLCLGFVYTEHNKRHEERIEIRFLTGKLGDILEASTFPGHQVVKIVC